MNWKLIFQLSLFGLFMAVGTVYFIPGNIEMLVWLPIFIISAWLIAKKAPGKYFWHGFVLSLVNSAWVVGAHAILVNTYLANHPEEVKMMQNMPMPEHPRYMMILIGPIVGIIFGLVLGLFCFIASKFVKKV